MAIPRTGQNPHTRYKKRTIKAGKRMQRVGGPAGNPGKPRVKRVRKSFKERTTI